MKPSLWKFSPSVRTSPRPYIHVSSGFRSCPSFVLAVQRVCVLRVAVIFFWLLRVFNIKKMYFVGVILHLLSLFVKWIMGVDLLPTLTCQFSYSHTWPSEEQTPDSKPRNLTHVVTRRTFSSGDI